MKKIFILTFLTLFGLAFHTKAEAFPTVSPDTNTDNPSLSQNVSKFIACIDDLSKMISNSNSVEDFQNQLSNMSSGIEYLANDTTPFTQSEKRAITNSLQNMAGQSIALACRLYNISPDSEEYTLAVSQGNTLISSLVENSPNFEALLKNLAGSNIF